jgi:SAM-dependent methyltransferase
MCKKCLDWLLTPVRLVLPHGFLESIGLTSVRQQRNNLVLKYVKGRLLDIGCGNNYLIKQYGEPSSVGIDNCDYGMGAVIIDYIYKLPFGNASFDTVAFVASFNHIPDRVKVIQEVNRVLKDDGIVIITMITPRVGKLRHMMGWIDRAEDARFNNFRQEGEREGLSDHYIINLFSNAGYRLKLRKKFLIGLNNMYVFERSVLKS